MGIGRAWVRQLMPATLHWLFLLICLEIHACLADAPEPDEEMPQELPESLLYAPLKGEAPADPKDLMVENAAPLKAN
ncbi:UNVERIFIED_CONTAM: hypothetical protein Sradi_6890200 [Sesamum radiatum]|uniref:Uncharacterized protein n=1 Tax=Sesamum radiatum TaxID=300843 RepID=A0AAW2JJ55_SESRA